MLDTAKLLKYIVPSASSRWGSREIFLLGARSRGRRFAQGARIAYICAFDWYYTAQTKQ